VPDHSSSFLLVNYLKTIFDNVGQSVLLVGIEPDNRYKVLLVNESFGKTSGFPRDIVGRYINEVIVKPGLYDHLIRRYRSAIETKQTITYSEWLDTPKGKRRFDVKIVPILNSVGETTQFVVISHDITEQYIERRERTAAIALNRYAAGDRRAFVVTDGDFMILRRVNVPESMQDWQLGTSLASYLSAIDLANFRELAKSGDAKKRASFRPDKKRVALSYAVFYDDEFKRYIVDIALD
jgi:PAS domain S-box-containing protein